MPCWWPYPFCPSGYKRFQRQNEASAKRQNILRKHAKKRVRKCAKNFRKYQSTAKSQLCRIRASFNTYCPTKPPCTARQGCAHQSCPLRPPIPPCSCSQESGDLPCTLRPQYESCSISPSCASLPCSKPKHPVRECCCSMGEASSPNIRAPCSPVSSCSTPGPSCPSLRGCNSGGRLCPPVNSCSCLNKRRKRREKQRCMSLTEMAYQSLFGENCECSPRAERKCRRRRRRPRTRNLCCRCIICWVAVGAIAFFAGYWIPVFAAVIPPP